MSVSKSEMLADALAGNIRLAIPKAKYTQAYVRNLLAKAGVPVDWSWGTRGVLKAGKGHLTVTFDAKQNEYVALWEPHAEL